MRFSIRPCPQLTFRNDLKSVWILPNPGGVNFPENDYIGAQYAILHWDSTQWVPTFHQVPYDLERLKRDYQKSGLLSVSPLARVMLQSILTGKDYLPVYFAYVNCVAKT